MFHYVLLVPGSELVMFGVTKCLAASLGGAVDSRVSHKMLHGVFPKKGQQY